MSPDRARSRRSRCGRSPGGGAGPGPTPSSTSLLDRGCGRTSRNGGSTLTLMSPGRLAGSRPPAGSSPARASSTCRARASTATAPTMRSARTSRSTRRSAPMRRPSGPVRGPLLRPVTGMGCRPVTSLRFFTSFGPRNRPDLAIARSTRLIDRGEPVPVFGDGTRRSAWTSTMGSSARSPRRGADHPAFAGTTRGRPPDLHRHRPGRCRVGPRGPAPDRRGAGAVCRLASGACVVIRRRIRAARRRWIPGASEAS
jgi:hypothetical protein